MLKATLCERSTVSCLVVSLLFQNVAHALPTQWSHPDVSIASLNAWEALSEQEQSVLGDWYQPGENWRSQEHRFANHYSKRLKTAQSEALSYSLLPSFPRLRPDGNPEHSSQAVYLLPVKPKQQYNGTTTTGNIKQFCAAITQNIENINYANQLGFNLGVKNAELVDSILDTRRQVKAHREVVDKYLPLYTRHQALIERKEQAVQKLEEERDDATRRLKEIRERRQISENEYSKLLAESQTGVPRTNETNYLVMKIEELRQKVDRYSKNLREASEEGDERGAKRNLLKLEITREDLNEAEEELDVLSEDYRLAKKQEAEDYFERYLANVDKQKTALKEKESQLSNLIFDSWEEVFELKKDEEYLEAEAKVMSAENSIDLLQRTTGAIDSLVSRQINNAVDASNLAKLNYLSIARNTAGIGQGLFNHVDDQMLAAERTISANSGISARQTTLYDLGIKLANNDSLAAPVVQIGTITFKGDRTAALEATLEQEGGRTSFEFHDAFFTEEAIVDSSVRVKAGGVENPDLTKVTYKRMQSSPEVRVKVGLGAFCGNLEAKLQEDHNSKVVTTKYKLVPRAHKNKFEVTAAGTYKIKAMLPPTGAKCDVNVENYSQFTRSWGTETSGFLWWRSSRSWDDVRQKVRESKALKCSFVSYEDVGGERDYADALNSMAVYEAMATLLSTTAKSYTVNALPEAELKSFKETHPRDTWSPTMLTICQGNPICEIVDVVFKSAENIGLKGGTSTTYSQSVNFQFNVSKARPVMLPQAMTSTISFNFNQ